MRFKASYGLLIWMMLGLSGGSQLPGQSTMPAPDQTVAALVATLESDATIFEKAKACQQLAVTGDGSAVPALQALLGDEQLATYARTALENIPDHEAGQALLDATQRLDGARLVGVIHSLGKRGEDSSTDRLSELLQSEDSQVGDAAAYALGQSGTVAAADVLADQFERTRGSRKSALAESCLLAIQQLAHKGHVDRSNALCRMLLEAELPEQVRLAAKMQMLMTDERDRAAAVEDMLKSNSSTEVMTALHVARRLGNTVDLVEPIKECFADQAPPIQASLIDYLAKQGHADARSLVLNAVREGVPDVQVAAVTALASLGTVDDVSMLMDLATSKAEGLSDAATQALIEIPDPEMDGAIVQRIRNNMETAVAGEGTDKMEPPQKEELVKAIEIASARQTSQARPLLWDLIRLDDPEIRQAALTGMGNVATREDLPRLLHLVNHGFDSGEVGDALTVACLRMPQAECATAMAQALPSLPVDGQVLLLEQLALVGGDQALQTVVSAARSESDAIQDAATRVLGEWLTADAAPAIYELTRSLPKGKYRTRMLRGYIRIARQLSMDMADRLEVCRNALNLAERDDERILVLDALRRHRCREGLEIAQSLLDHPKLKSRVIAAIDRIRQDAPLDETGFVPIFDGQTLDGWKGGDLSFWSVEDGAIVGGDLENKVKQNEFLRTTKAYGDFELRLKFKLIGDRTNGGVQIRTAEIPDHHEVSGYQADLGDGWWGCLYDESRRRKVLAGPPEKERAKPVVLNEWNDYRILCEGKRIRLWINDVPTVDYTEPDPEIPLTGIIAVQVHGNLKMKAFYKDLRIKELGQKN